MMHKARSFFLLLFWKISLDKLVDNVVLNVIIVLEMSVVLVQKRKIDRQVRILSLYMVMSGVHPPPENKILLYAP